MNQRFMLLVQFVCLLAFPIAAFSQWQPNGNPIAVAPGDEWNQVMCYDGSGGTIIAWLDDVDTKIYAQRFDASGSLLWAANGVSVTTDLTSTKWDPTLLPDGSGGAFIAWSDDRNDPFVTVDVFVQHISSAGTLLWNAPGVPVCTAIRDQYDPHLVTDMAGGIIVAWEDRRSLQYKIFAQRVDGTGTAQWVADGIQLSDVLSQQFFGTTFSQMRGSGSAVVSDGAGGAIATFAAIQNVYAQRISGTGALLWTVSGVTVCGATGIQDYPIIAPGGSNGTAIVTWLDSRVAPASIYAQSISAAGATEWTANGVLVSANAFPTNFADICADGSGGAIIVYPQNNNSGTADIFAQRLNASGSKLWPAAGVTVCSATDHQSFARVISDGSGGAFIAWEDRRNGSTRDIYAQRLNQSGIPLWANDGTAVCLAANDQYRPVMVPNTPSGVSIAWTDERAVFGQQDVYALRVEGTNTPIGSNVAVSLGNPVTPDAIVTYQSVSSAGITSLTLNPSCSNPTPPGFVMVGSTCYDITSSAVYSGSVEVCLHYDDTSLPQPEASLRILHYESSQWVDITTSLDTNTNYICGATTSLSPFIVGFEPVTGVNPGTPSTFALNQNVPNPFNPTTLISYDVPSEGARVSIVVYDISGRLVRTLLDEQRPAGHFSVEWDGRNATGQTVASGIYFYRMAARGFVDTKKMVLLK